MTDVSGAIGGNTEGQAVQTESGLQYDKEIAKRFAACLNSGFPICLDMALREIFEEGRINKLKGLVKKEADIPNVINVSSPKDIWDLYVKYLIAWKKGMGGEATKVIEFKAMENMKDLHCEKCPAYDLELLRFRKPPKPSGLVLIPASRIKTMESSIPQRQSVCDRHKVRLQVNEFGRTSCPVCDQIANQDSMRRKGRKR